MHIGGGISGRDGKHVQHLAVFLTTAAKADRQGDPSDFARSQLHLHLATED